MQQTLFNLPMRDICNYNYFYAHNFCMGIKRTFIGKKVGRVCRRILRKWWARFLTQLVKLKVYNNQD